jgi:hypothetical protein
VHKAQESYGSSEKWRFRGVFSAFFAIAAIFLVAPLFEKNFYTHLLLHCSCVVLILSTVYAIDGKRTVLKIGISLLLPFIYFDSLSFQHHSHTYMMVAYGFSSLFTLMAIIILMKKILHCSLVTSQLVFAALMVYLLAGIFWANLYFIINVISPGSFAGAGTIHFGDVNFVSAYEQQFNFLYYSFATLATLGMGDITPLNHLAKSLTALEAMFGQMFVAIIIAKLVSVWWFVPDKT